jgi:hypothetical protein
MTSLAYDDAFATHQLVRLGNLALPTGRVVVCDPYFCAGAEPFARAVAPGSYEVELCIVASPDWGRRVALARIVFDRDTQPARYEEAVKEPSGATGFFVDSGVASYLDLETRDVFANVLADHYRRNPDGNYYLDVLAAEFKRSAFDPDDPFDVGRWNMHDVPGSTLNVAMFSSGLGDGSFRSFWGVNEHDAATSLVTDFGLL